MAISIEFKDKYVYFGPEAGLHTQGEARAEVYDVTGPRYHDGHDLSAMTWYVRASHPDYMTLINKQLGVSVDPDNEGQIIITWPVEADFTAYAGQLDVQFVAKSSTGEEIIKLQSNGLAVCSPASRVLLRLRKMCLRIRWNKCRGFWTTPKMPPHRVLRTHRGRKMLKRLPGKAPRQRSKLRRTLRNLLYRIRHWYSRLKAMLRLRPPVLRLQRPVPQRRNSSAQGCKGWFVNVAALRAAYPTGTDGEWAILGSTDSIWVWDADSSDSD